MAPISKQSLRLFWEDFKTDMFAYKAVKEAPVLRGLTENLDAMLRQENSTEKVEQLLTLQEKAESEIKKLERPQLKKMLIAGGLMMTASLVLSGLAVATAGGIVPMAIFCLPFCKYMLNSTRSFEVGRAIKENINSEVQQIGNSDPNHVFNSPKVQQRLIGKGYLSQAFATLMDNPAKEYDRIRPKPAGFQIKLKQEP